MPAGPSPARLLICLAAPLLGGCALFGIERPGPAPADPSVAVYRAAMADFATCQTDPANRAAAAARLDSAAARLQAETRPTNPDHFYMTDRVTAAAARCAETLPR
jgi:hypothetical protein